MTHSSKLLAGMAVSLFFLTVSPYPALAQSADDGPGRGVARISVINGDVSLRRGDTGDWTAAAINAPLVVQDRIFTGANSRAELQFDHANMIRMASNAELRLAELEYARYTVQLARGLVTFRVLRNQESDVEISTPSVAVRPVKKGTYRIAVREDGSTEISVRGGEAEIFTPRGVERLKSGRTMLARGTASDPEFQLVADIPDDDWDRWNERRDRDLERSGSYRYVSRDIYGAEDLDGHGRWVYVAPYGYVWSPFVTAGWAPYRLGRWSWIDYYGWSWVSYDPWGWAPYHYGRWFHQPAYGWLWWPGGLYTSHYWRPALVSFFGFGVGSVNVGIGFGFGRIGWCPLAPYEVFRPWYGPGFYGRSGFGNRVTVVNNVNITNVYRNARVNNAVTVVDGADFSRGRVTAIRSLNDGDVQRASLIQGQVPVVPERESLRLADREVRVRSAETSRDGGRFYSRRETQPVERVSFEEQRASIEQATRRSFGEETARSSGSPGAESPRQTSGETGRGWRSAGEPARSVGATRSAEDSSSQGGWRRFGEPSRTESGRSSGTENRGWRSADAPASRGAESPSVGRSAADDRGGWRRFGEPNRDNSGMVDRSESGSRRSSESNEGWRGIGTRRESRSESPSGSIDTPRRSESPPYESPRYEQRRSESPRYESPRIESPRYERRESEAPVRISPPIVRERAPDSGGRSSGGRSYEGPRGGGDFGGRSSGPPPSSGGMRGGDGGGGRSGGGEGAGRSSGGESRGGGRIR
ncbi:MAG: hypothetical protein FJW20_07695 [Acidimicrobiia bacterium]|nr:hypothetical protein [Acidimicrobiia bacterium]